jgi:hypothetical protein
LKHSICIESALKWQWREDLTNLFQYYHTLLINEFQTPTNELNTKTPSEKFEEFDELARIAAVIPTRPAQVSSKVGLISSTGSKKPKYPSSGFKVGFNSKM